MGNVIAIGLTPSRTGIVIGPSRTGIVIGLQHDWSSATPKGPLSQLSLSPFAGSRLQLA